MVKIISFNRPTQQIVIESEDGTNKLPISFKEWEHLATAYEEMVGGGG